MMFVVGEGALLGLLLFPRPPHWVASCPLCGHLPRGMEKRRSRAAPPGTSKLAIGRPTDRQDPGTGLGLGLGLGPTAAVTDSAGDSARLSSREDKIFCRTTYAMLVLQETPAGFALFSVADKKIKEADKVRRGLHPNRGAFMARSRCLAGIRAFRACAGTRSN